MSDVRTQQSRGEKAQSAAADAGAQAKEKTREAAEQAQGRVREEVDRRSTEVGEQATGAADALRQAADQLREQSPAAGRAVEEVATRVERAGGWLRESDGDRILRDVEDFGRHNPLAVAAGGMVLGFAASRLLKASSGRRAPQGGSYADGRAARAQIAPGAATTTGPYGDPARDRVGDMTERA
jgi:hypothetical protein